jgi:hypothetical protein
MNLTKTGTLGLLLLGVVLCAFRADAQTQAWQNVWPDDDKSAAVAPATAAATASANDNWQPVGAQRETKRPQPTAQQWISPRRDANVRQAAYEDGTPEVVKTPMGTPAPVRKNASVGGATRQGEFQVASPDAVLSGDIAAPRPGCSSCAHRGGEVVDGDCGGNSCGDCGECDECAPCDQCPQYEVFNGCCMHLFRDLSVFAGVDGFKGPMDHGANGNFGFNEGLNYAGPLGDPWGCGYQIGANFVQSDFSGAPNYAGDGQALDASYRRQVFVTGGLFRRGEVGEFQGGIAFDYLNDDYYVKSDLKQLRSELGYVFNAGWDAGFYGAFSLGNVENADGTFTTASMYTLYVRHNFENGGNGRIFGGATGYGNGVLGADLWIPLGGGIALENSATYMIPKQGTSETGQSKESWGLAIQLVWYPGQSANCAARNVYRPLFSVANNAVMMEEQLPR